jgi:hypothetical protein
MQFAQYRLQIVAGSGTITTLASFDGANGADPVTGLLADGSDYLYGTTFDGGPGGGGTALKSLKTAPAIVPKTHPWAGPSSRPVPSRQVVFSE